MSPIIGARSFGRWTISSIGGGGGPWWWGTMYGYSGYNYLDGDHGLASDIAGNIYISRGGQNTSYVPSGEVLSVSNAGAFRWAKTTFGGSYLGVGGFKSTNLSMAGYGGSNHGIVNFTSAGTLSYGKVFGDNYNSGNTICTFPVEDGSTLSRAMFYYGGDYREGVIRIDSAGTVAWNRTMKGGAGYEFDCGIYHKGSYSYYWINGALAKIDSSGTFVQNRYIAINNSRMIGVDSSDNVYGGSYNSVSKYDSSLIPVWGLSISPGDNTFSNTSKCSTFIDSSANVYHVLAVGSATLRVIKISSGGTVQWVRKLTNSAMSGTGYKWSFTITANNDLVFSMFQHTYPWQGSEYVIKLPNDGTKTGSYYPFTWATETALTITTTTPSQSNASLQYNGPGSLITTTSNFGTSSTSYWGSSGDIT